MWQFSIRSVLVLLTVAAVVFAVVPLLPIRTPLLYFVAFYAVWFFVWRALLKWSSQ